MKQTHKKCARMCLYICMFLVVSLLLASLAVFAEGNDDTPENSPAPEKTPASVSTPTPESTPANTPAGARAPENTPENSLTPETSPTPQNTPGVDASPIPDPTTAPTCAATTEPTADATPEVSVTPEIAPETTQELKPVTWSIDRSGIVKIKTIMRAAPYSSANSVRTLYRGDEIQVLSGISIGSKTWYLIKSGERRGYAPSSSIVVQTSADDGSGMVKTKRARTLRISWSGTRGAQNPGMAIPKLYQFNYTSVLCYYGGVPRSVSTSGCNVTCVSMVVAYLTGNTNQSPETMFDWAIDNRLYYGYGLGHEGMSSVAAHWGVGSRWISNDADRIRAALKKGYPVIAHMGDGQFTSEGHYIVLCGLSDDGKVFVNDPNSKSNSGKTYKLSTILEEARRNDSSFMVCYPPNGEQEN